MKRLHLVCVLLLPFSLQVVTAEDTTLPREELQVLVNAQNQFALDLFAQLRKGDENLFVSPFSIAQALTLTASGVRGESAAELLKCLHLDDFETDRIHPAMGRFRCDLIEEQKGCSLSMANGLWIARGEPILKTYLQLARDHYDAEVAMMDFAGTPEESRTTINAWIEKQTNELIKKMLRPGAVDANLVMVLANAVYFKAGWATEFNKKNTTSQYFHVRSDRKVAVPMMKQMIYFQYTRDKDCQVLEMPYLGDRLSFVMLLPHKKDGLSDLEKTLTLENLNVRLAKLKKAAVSVMMPRFSLRSDVDLLPALTNLGVKRALSPEQADFSGIRAGGGLFLDLVLHNASVDVSEEGTEAAAATIVRLSKNGGRHPIHFTADHPFLFMIRDRQTGALLFLGRFIEPTECSETKPRRENAR